MPHPRPVQKIELSESNTTRRLIAAGLFLLIGAGALAYGISQLFTPEAGWQRIEAGTAEGPTCANEFVFLYELGASGQAIRTESRELTALYTQACRKAFQLFHTVEGFEDVVNLYEINRQPNEVLEVDQVLYDAFAAMEEAGDRTVYLGPVYARYGDLFYCTDDSQLVDFDPRLSDEVREEYAAYAAYASDPEAIGVELLGDGKIRLRVSEDYLAFARRESVDRFLDFGWMKNAFVADYLAQTMAEGGYTNGCITSDDGFARCLDGRGMGYALNLLDDLEGRAIEAGTVEYQGPMSMASLRTFPAVAGDELRFYRLKDGQARTLYLDPEDGLCRGSVESLTCYSKECGCVRLALEAGAVFIADAFDRAALERLAEESIYAVWCHDRTLQGTEPSLTVSNLYRNDSGVSYSVIHP